MRIQGKITRWNADKGYGFITPSTGPKEVFVHINAFTAGAEPPKIGEVVSFVLSTDQRGRPRAVDVARPGQQPPSRPVHRTRRTTVSRVGWMMVLVLLAAAILSVSRIAQSPSAIAMPVRTSAPTGAPARLEAFKCDGRTHCSQMSSCEEATYFIGNCPGTQMDGDRDGVPCESQWCR